VTVYLNASAVLRVLLRQSKPLAAWGRWDAAYASELLGVEARRVIDRLQLQRRSTMTASPMRITAWHEWSEASAPSP
jgi:hypothetical protein